MIIPFEPFLVWYRHALAGAATTKKRARTIAVRLGKKQLGLD